MKSVQVAAYDSTNAHKYTDLKVMRSGAGWYIGTEYEYVDQDSGCTIAEPGSRDTNYFPTEELAKAAFDLMPRFVLPDGKLDAGAWSYHATFVLKTRCDYRFNP